jgi:hypothetical protein
MVIVSNYFKKQFPEKSENYIARETCNATCTSRASFYRIKKEAVQNPVRTTPPPPK